MKNNEQARDPVEETRLVQRLRWKGLAEAARDETEPTPGQSTKKRKIRDAANRKIGLYVGSARNPAATARLIPAVAGLLRKSLSQYPTEDGVLYHHLLKAKLWAEVEKLHVVGAEP